MQQCPQGDAGKTMPEILKDKCLNILGDLGPYASA